MVGLVPTATDDVGETPLSDVAAALRTLGAGIGRGGDRLGAVVEAHGLHEVLSAELVAALATYVRGRARAKAARAALTAAAAPPAPYVVLEVGAGDGALGGHLASAVAADAALGDPPITVTVTDSLAHTAVGGGPRDRLPDAAFPVEPAEQGSAVAAAAPDLVIASWMPAGVDWTAGWRAAGVGEYLLLGEADDGCCGCAWRTWGNPAAAPMASGKAGWWGAGAEGAPSSPPTAPYRVDGYTRVALGGVSRWMISRFDAPGVRNAAAVAFRRGGGSGAG
ncbi:hypothetical protein MMPV_007196 [Pyropia vietnamensis]